MSNLLRSDEVLLIDEESAPTDPPDGSTDPLYLRRCDTARVIFEYDGVVDACNAVLWSIDSAGEWFEVFSTDQADPLVPEDGKRESRDWDLGEGEGFALEIRAISGGGSVTAKVKGVLTS